MDCDLCQIRSSVGYCAECKRLLCEVCGVACTECGKTVCVTHVHETRSGKRLCADCAKARKHRHKHHHEPEELEDTRFGALEGQPGGDEEADEERAILTASAYQPIPPWKLSLYAGGAAAGVMVVVLLVPQFRLIAQPWSSFVAIALCVLSGVWSVYGLVSPAHYENRGRNFIGMGLAVVAVVMAGAALQFRTDTRGDDSLEAGMMERRDMSPQELREWRRRRLEKFNPQRVKPDDTGAP